MLRSNGKIKAEATINPYTTYFKTYRSPLQKEAIRCPRNKYSTRLAALFSRLRLQRAWPPQVNFRFNVLPTRPVVRN